MVPAKPPQPTADAESFATSQMLGLGLSGAVLPGKVLRSVCEQRRVLAGHVIKTSCKQHCCGHHDTASAVQADGLSMADSRGVRRALHLALGKLVTYESCFGQTAEFVYVKEQIAD